MRPRWLAVPVALVALAAVWGFVIEPNRLVVRETRLVLPRWPAALDGLRLAVVADIHAGAPWIDENKVERLVAEVNDTRPDLVVLLGDFVILEVLGGRSLPPEPTAQRLAGLRAPLGVVAILGNHDWWYDGPRVRRALEGAGVPVLENAALRLERQGTPFWLVGLADVWTREPDVVGPLRDIPADEAVIVLTHNPDVFPRIPARVALTLAGHTHGGQMMLDRQYGTGPVLFRYWSGLYTRGRSQMIVSNGVGNMFPIRINAPAEIVHITLRSAGTHG